MGRGHAHRDTDPERGDREIKEKAYVVHGGVR
jgi:hypothetical protein